MNMGGDHAVFCHNPGLQTATEENIPQMLNGIVWFAGNQDHCNAFFLHCGKQAGYNSLISREHIRNADVPGLCSHNFLRIHSADAADQVNISPHLAEIGCHVVGKAECGADAQNEHRVGLVDCLHGFMQTV